MRLVTPEYVNGRLTDPVEVSLDEEHHYIQSCSCWLVLRQQARVSSLASILIRILIMSDNDSDDLGIPRRGVVPAYGHRGWQGEELELAHATKQPAASGEGGAAKDGAAVDLSQFRNEEVGKGYQAKFVVRQPSAGEPVKVAVQDLSSATKKDKKKASKKERKEKRKNPSSPEDKRKSAKKVNRVDQYLNSKALREFRKELEKF